MTLRPRDGKWIRRSLGVTGLPFLGAGRKSGRVLAEEVQRHLPGTAVLYISGYTEDSIVHHGRLDNGIQLLQEPFRMSDLASAVRRALANYSN